MISGVFEVQRELEMNLFSCLRMSFKSPVLIAGGSLALGKICLYDAMVSNVDDVLILSLTTESWWISVPPLECSLSPGLVDLCAGTRAMSIGAQFMGAAPMVATDWNDTAVARLQVNHKGSVLHLDVSSPSAAKLIHQACDQHPGTGFLGFPCQPHSYQGQQRGSADPRAQVLWHGLGNTFQLQAQSMILECTPAAGDNPDVQQGLRLLADAMNWDVLQIGGSSSVESFTEYFGAQAWQLLPAERISIGWNESCHLTAAAQSLARDATLHNPTLDGLTMHSQDGPADRVQPLQPIVIAIKHHGLFLVHLAQPGIFLFEVLAKKQLPWIRKALDLKGCILPVDERIWHPIPVITLDFLPWNQPVVYFQIAQGPETSHRIGLHDGQIWACLHSLLRDTDHDAKSALVIHPAFASAMQHAWISAPHEQHLREQFAASSGHIVCIFAADGHWMLLWGTPSADGLCWTCYDGLRDHSLMAATHLASRIVTVLGLDFCPLHHCCQTVQVDPHTCGTIALVHLFQILHPDHYIPAHSVRLLHHWILEQPSLTGSIYATGSPLGVGFAFWTDPVALGLHDGQVTRCARHILRNSLSQPSSAILVSPLTAAQLLHHPLDFGSLHLLRGCFKWLKGRRDLYLCSPRSLDFAPWHLDFACHSLDSL
eukprot:s87_g28.t1